MILRFYVSWFLPSISYRCFLEMAVDPFCYGCFPNSFYHKQSNFRSRDISSSKLCQWHLDCFHML